MGERTEEEEEEGREVRDKGKGGGIILSLPH